MDAFQHSFKLDKHSPDFSNLQGNIVSVLQVRSSLERARAMQLTPVGWVFLRRPVFFLRQ